MVAEEGGGVVGGGGDALEGGVFDASCDTFGRGVDGTGELMVEGDGRFLFACSRLFSRAVMKDSRSEIESQRRCLCL